MPAPEWTVTAIGLTGAGLKLVGCHIFLNPTNYTFTKPDNTLLATTPGTTLPQTFSTFNYKGIDWTITLTSALVGSNATGAWSVPPGSESGYFTAPTGAGIDEEEAASSAHT